MRRDYISERGTPEDRSSNRVELSRRVVLYSYSEGADCTESAGTGAITRMV